MTSKKVDLYDREGNSVGKITLKEAIFGQPINVHVMHQAVRVYLNSLRRGTHSTKTRGLVSGGGKKPWRQKGTGRASFGSSRNPVWRGGGVAFGPHPRSHSITMPKKQRRIALLSALSSKAQNGDIIVFDELSFETPKTKELVDILSKVGADNALLVMEKDNENAVLSARNIPSVKTAAANSLNTYAVLHNDKLVLTKASLAAIEEVLI